MQKRQPQSNDIILTDALKKLNNNCSYKINVTTRFYFDTVEVYIGTPDEIKNFIYNTDVHIVFNVERLPFKVKPQAFVK